MKGLGLACVVREEVRDSFKIKDWAFIFVNKYFLKISILLIQNLYLNALES